MKISKPFLWTLTLTACLTFADRWLIGSDSPEVRPLAKPRGSAVLQDCRVAGRIESRPQGIFAVFEFENPTDADKTLAFHYLAARTPPMSPFSRMMPMPETVRSGFLEHVTPSGSSLAEILLKDAAPATADPALTNAPAVDAAAPTGAVARAALAMSPEIWSLTIAREPIKAVRGWGAVGPVPAGAPLSLDKGEAVLAVTVSEKAAP